MHELAEPAAPQPVPDSDGARIDPPVKPRVWTLALALVALVLGSLAASAAVGFVYALIQAVRQPDLARDQVVLVRLIHHWLGTPPGLLAAFATSGAAVVVTTLLAAVLSKTPLRQRLRLGPSSLTPLGYVAAVLGSVALGAASGAVIDLAGLGDQGSLARMSRVFGHMSGATLLAALAIVGLLAGVAEELFFRGYLQSRLSARWRRWPAILVTAALFALIHFDWVQSAFALFMGIWLGWIGERFGSVRPTIAGHVGNNVMAMLMIAWYPGQHGDLINSVWLVLGLTVLAVCLPVLRRQPDALASPAPATIPAPAPSARRSPAHPPLHL